MKLKLKEALKETEEKIEKKIERKRVPIDKLDSMLNYQRDIDMHFVEENSKNGILRKVKSVSYL